MLKVLIFEKKSARDAVIFLSVFLQSALWRWFKSFFEIC